MPERSLSNRASVGGTVGGGFDGHPQTSSFAAVSSLLWTERELLERALFALTVQRMMLGSGNTRFLARSTDDVRAVLEQISGSEVLRSAEIEALAETMRLPHDTTLAELAAIAPEPWSDLLGEHRDVLRDLLAQIEAAGTEIRAMLNSGLSAIGETLDGLDRLDGLSGLGGPDAAGRGYDALGNTVRRARGPILLDENL